MGIAGDNKVPTVLFDRELKFGDDGNDVKDLQIFLNRQGFFVAQSGQGSLCQESTHFDSNTESALIRFQKAYSDETLRLTGHLSVYGCLDKNTIDLINFITFHGGTVPMSSQGFLARVLGIVVVSVSGLVLIGWYIDIRLFFAPVGSFILVGNITFYFFAIFYFWILFVFIRRLNSWTDGQIWVRSIAIAMFLVCMFICIGNGDILSRYISSTQDAGINIQEHTSQWRELHCNPVQDVDKVCTDTDPQEYRCDDSSTYCATF